ncbi:MAG TPA: aldo/keto reductase [Terrimicrobiaceae bacterium]|nr:aldo/keto reductase [Terrimicrobiaceae bacterium]
MLGTVQFGLNYGIANRTGAPSHSEVCAMLVAGAEGGINCLDTARTYGNSEEVLGRALEETGLKDHYFVVTKIDSQIPPDLTGEETKAAIQKSLEESLRRLRLDVLPLVLLHRDDYPAQMDALESMRERGLTKRCGVSLGFPNNAPAFLSHPALAAIQAPVNVLDRRFDEAIRAAKSKSAFVFARSTYLQGLLLMDDASTPPHLLSIRDERAIFHKMAADLGITPSALLLKAALQRDDLDAVVFGVETITQLRENLAVFHSDPLPEDLLKTIHDYRYHGPEWMLHPALWSEHKEAKS